MTEDYDKLNYVLAPFPAAVPAVILLIEQVNKAIKYPACSYRYGKCVLFNPNQKLG